MPDRNRKLAGLALMFGNLVVDLLLPTVVLLALAPTGLPAAVRLAIGGTLLSGKAIGGRIEAGEFRWRLALIAGLLPAAAIAIGYAAGLGAVPSMVLGAVVSAAFTLGHFLRGRGARRIDAVAVGILVEVVASVVLTSISGDARFVLARTSVYLALAGVVILATTGAEHPVMRTALKPVATAGDLERAAAFDRCWAASRRFRGLYRWMTASLGGVFLIDAGLRIVIIYSQPPGDVTSTSITSQLPLIGLIVLWFAGNRGLVVPRAQRILDAEVARSRDAVSPDAGPARPAVRPGSSGG